MKNYFYIFFCIFFVCFWHEASGAVSFEYHLRDHLGSTRVAFVPTASETEVVQENSYYPFGAPIADLSWSPKSTNRYGYNGKEHIKEFDLDWIDLGRRIYNPLIGQFSTSDRFAEKYYSLSNYSFAAGNPIKIIDMNGDSTVLAGWNSRINSFNNDFHNGVADRVNNPALLLNDLNNMAGGILQLLADFTGISDLFGTNQTAAAIDNAINEVSNIPNMSAEEVGSMLAGVSIFAIETAATRKIPLGGVGKAANVAKGGTVAFRSFTSGNFRYNLGKLTGNMPANSQAHHVFPQAFQERFTTKGINIHDPKFGVWWETSSHLKNANVYNSAWESFLRTNPTQPQILDKGRQLMQQYGISVGF
jgi:RHS repeat-associated protein